MPLSSLAPFRSRWWLQTFQDGHSPSDGNIDSESVIGYGLHLLPHRRGQTERSLQRIRQFVKNGSQFLWVGAAQVLRAGESHGGLVLFPRSVRSTDYGYHARLLTDFWTEEGERWDWRSRIVYLPRSPQDKPPVR